MSSIAIAGLFEPGSVVDLYRREGENSLRFEGGGLVDRKRADGDGNVRFDGLADGPFYAYGFAFEGVGRHSVRCLASDDPDSFPHAQPPVKPNPRTVVGTQEAVLKDPPPASLTAPQGAQPDASSAPQTNQEE